MQKDGAPRCHDSRYTITPCRRTGNCRMELTLDISVVDEHRYKIAASDGKNRFEHIIQRRQLLGPLISWRAGADIGPSSWSVPYRAVSSCRFASLLPFRSLRLPKPIVSFRDQPSRRQAILS